MQEEDRFGYIDAVKGFAILSMVLCHCGLHNTLTQWIYSFHMPFFFFVSGFLCFSKKRSVLPLVRKKAYQLLIPFFVFSLILCFGNNGMKDWIYVFYASRNSLAIAQSFTPLWFLPCFFLSVLLFQLISNISEKHFSIGAIVSVCIGIIGFLLSKWNPIVQYGAPFSLNIAFVGVLVMFIGGLSSKFNLYYKHGLIIYIIITFIVGSILAFVNLPDSLTSGNPHVEMATGSFGNPVLFLITACLLSFSLMALFYLVRGKSILRRILCFYGKNSLLVLCLHGFFFPLFLKAMVYLHVNQPYSLLITFLLTTAILYPAINFFNKYLPFFFGKVK